MKRHKHITEPTLYGHYRRQENGEYVLMDPIKRTSKKWKSKASPLDYIWEAGGVWRWEHKDKKDKSNFGFTDYLVSEGQLNELTKGIEDAHFVTEEKRSHQSWGR